MKSLHRFKAVFLLAILINSCKKDDVISSDGNAIIFNPDLTYGTITDIDANIYKTIDIGTQTWMAENLKTTKYNDGTVIPNITDNTAWAALTTPAYCWYDNDTNYKSNYGALYNWYVVNAGSNGGKNVCSIGWHVPSDAEWTTLTTYLGGASVAGGKLKETGTIHWSYPNTGATNETGFTALPSAYRFDNGSCNNIGFYGGWWSSTEVSATIAYDRCVGYDYTAVGKGGGVIKWRGASVRCVKD